MQIADWMTSQSGHSDESDQRDLSLLLAHVLGVNSAWLMAHQDHQLNTSQLQQLAALSQQLLAGKPLSQLTGKRAFWDLELQVNEHTLIPRPDTETLIEVVLDLSLEPRSILDLGTGSGAIALVLARLYPQAQVLGVDVSSAALEVAAQNRHRLHIKNLELLQSDWFDRIPEQPFDLIVSNPPYIASDDAHLEQLSHEPRLALVAEDSGLGAYRRICQAAGKYLLPGGWLVFEHGWQQDLAVAEIMQDNGFTRVGTRKDLQGHPRITSGQWPDC